MRYADMRRLRSGSVFSEQVPSLSQVDFPPRLRHHRFGQRLVEAGLGYFPVARDGPATGFSLSAAQQIREAPKTAGDPVAVEITGSPSQPNKIKGFWAKKGEVIQWPPRRLPEKGEKCDRTAFRGLIRAVAIIPFFILSIPQIHWITGSES